MLKQIETKNSQKSLENDDFFDTQSENAKRENAKKVNVCGRIVRELFTHCRLAKTYAPENLERAIWSTLSSRKEEREGVRRQTKPSKERVTSICVMRNLLTPNPVPARAGRRRRQFAWLTYCR